MRVCFFYFDNSNLLTLLQTSPVRLSLPIPPRSLLPARSPVIFAPLPHMTHSSSPLQPWATLQLTWTSILLASQLWQVARQMTTLEVSNLGRYGFMGGRGGASLSGQMGHRHQHHNSAVLPGVDTEDTSLVTEAGAAAGGAVAPPPPGCVRGLRERLPHEPPRLRPLHEGQGRRRARAGRQSEQPVSTRASSRTAGTSGRQGASSASSTRSCTTFPWKVSARQSGGASRRTRKMACARARGHARACSWDSGSAALGAVVAGTSRSARHSPADAISFTLGLVYLCLFSGFLRIRDTCVSSSSSHHTAWTCTFL